jgi:hypothetical protein
MLQVDDSLKEPDQLAPTSNTCQMVSHGAVDWVLMHAEFFTLYVVELMI